MFKITDSMILLLGLLVEDHRKTAVRFGTSESLKTESLGLSTFTEIHLTAILIGCFLIESNPLEFLTAGLKSAIALLSRFLFAIT